MRSAQLLLVLGFVAVSAEIVLGNRQKRSDKKIVVTTIEELPFVELKSREGQGNGNFKGFIPDLMAEIAKKANLKYELKLVSDGKYGQSEGGQWTGMIGQVIRGEADMAGAPMTITDSRKNVVDFTDPFMSVGTVILIKKPKEGQKLTVNTPKDLADQTEIDYGLVKGGSTEIFFSKSSDPTLRKMYIYMQSSPKSLVTTVEDGVNRVRSGKGKYAFIIESQTADYWVNQEPCDLMVIKGINQPERNYGLALKKNSQYMDKVNTALLQLKNSGKVDELRTKWWDTGACSAGSRVSGLHFAVVTATTFVLSIKHLLY